MTAAIYWDRGLQFPSSPDCELVELDTQLVPALLSGIAGRLGPSHWENEAAYLEGYERLSRQGAALLMGCKEDIIVELRALRDSTPGAPAYDTATYPVGMWPGVSMATLVNLLYAEPNSTAELLTQIRDQLAASGEGSADQLELLGQIVLLLGA